MPKVTVILMHQLDCNRKYLDLAMRALALQTYDDFEVRVMSGAESPLDWDEWPYSPHAKYLRHDRRLDTSVKKIRAALDESDSELILIHSDDVFLSQTAIRVLAQTNSGFDFPQGSIMNPFSNSDCRSLYRAHLCVDHPEKGRKIIGPDMSYEDLVGYESQIIKWTDTIPIIVPFATLSFFCTVMPRRLYEHLGGLEPALEYRHNDQDFCLKARQIGVPSLVNFQAFAFHFGTKTLNHLSTEADKQRASEFFINKWSQKA